MLKNVSLLLGIVSVILGGISWFIGSGPLMLVLVVLVGLCVYLSIILGKRLRKEGRKREATIGTVMSQIGFF